MAANWFIKGHRNKLTADGSRIDQKHADDMQSEKRIRLQWDVSFQVASSGGRHGGHGVYVYS
jgi:hypothetical protein